MSHGLSRSPACGEAYNPASNFPLEEAPKCDMVWLDV